NPMSVLPETQSFAREKSRDAMLAAMNGKPTLIGLSRAEMGEALAEIGVAERQVKMRVAQLWHWLYVRGVSDFADMLNISRDMR
ncbi:hypothetical protein, partial [Klebsiella pneumoniae]|uniref:hypothetical protein n=1 Tax=Klebsiella pneumoniae TaxID=573 RepID=UPI0019542F62